MGLCLGAAAPRGRRALGSSSAGRGAWGGWEVPTPGRGRRPGCGWGRCSGAGAPQARTGSLCSAVLKMSSRWRSVTGPSRVPPVKGKGLAVTSGECGWKRC